MSVIRVSFRDFWPGFRPEGFFLPLLRMGLADGVTEPAEAAEPAEPLELQVVAAWAPCDLELVSVFPQGIGTRRRVANAGRRVLGRPNLEASRIGMPSPWARRSIWFTAENRRPPIADWQATWSFEADSALARNCAFPLWYLLFPELVGLPIQTISPENRSGRPLTLEMATSARTTDINDRSKFACAFIGNPEPTRMRAIQALRRIGEVDVFGPSTGTVVPDKWQVARDYKFMLCFENSVTPGYVTEKAFDAWSCGTIPIWNGIDRDGFLNPSALVNLADLGGSLEALTARIEQLMDDPDERARIASARILVRRPDLSRILSSLRPA